MATCGNCGTETARIRCRWKEGRQLPDECPTCAPQSFEAFKSVRDGKIAMGWEYMPNMYRKTDAGYVATDELLADTEMAATKQSDDDKRVEQEILERKRANRRTKPLSPAEISQAISRWNNISIQ